MFNIKETQYLLSTARYQLSVSFDSTFVKTKEVLKTVNEDLGTIKRNNEGFEKLAMKYKDKSEISKGLKALILINNLLQSLENIIGCQSPKNSINYIEEKYCYHSISYIFENIIYMLFSCLGILLISVGVDKTSILADKDYDKLREGVI